MRRRINHWASQGFIWTLGQVDDTLLQQSYKRFASTLNEIPQRKDTALGRTLQILGDDHISEIMSNHPIEYTSEGGVKIKDTSIPKLQDAFKKALSPLTSSEPVVIYSQDTCVEFHHLLLSVLHGYGRSLAGFQALHTDNSLYGNTEGCAKTIEEIEEHEKVIEEGAKQVWRYVYLLWRISYSRILRYHLSSLEASQTISFPVVTSRGLYSRFTDFKSCKDDDEEMENEFRRLRSLHSYNEFDGQAQGFQRWQRLHVTQFATLDILSSGVARREANLSPNIDIRLIAVQQQRYALDDWKTAITDVVTVSNANANAPSLNADTIIQRLEKHIREFSKSPLCAPIVKNFASLTPTFSGTVHCEAALAALIKYVSLLTLSEDDQHELGGLIKVCLTYPL